MKHNTPTSYAAFSFKIDSEIPLDIPQYNSGNAESQQVKTLFLHKAAVNHEFAPIASIEIFEFGTLGNDLILHVFKVGRFCIHDFSTIETLDTIQVDVDVFPDTKPYAIAHVIDTILMAFLVRSDKGVQLHGSSVVKDSKAVVLVGSCGSGKSTTAASLVSRGWTPLCDDLSPLLMSEDNKSIFVLPGIPAPSLLSDAYSKLANGISPKESGPGRPGKRRLFETCQKRPNNRYPLAAILCLSIGEVEKPLITTISGYARVQMLVSNLSSIPGLDAPRSQLEKVIAIQDKIQIYSLIRPNGLDSLAAVTDIIDSIILPSKRACV